MIQVYKDIWQVSELFCSAAYDVTEKNGDS